jgi:hypothetical protein
MHAVLWCAFCGFVTVYVAEAHAREWGNVFEVSLG